MAFKVGNNKGTKRKKEIRIHNNALEHFRSELKRGTTESKCKAVFSKAKTDGNKFLCGEQ